MDVASVQHEITTHITRAYYDVSESSARCSHGKYKFIACCVRCTYEFTATLALSMGMRHVTVLLVLHRDTKRTEFWRLWSNCWRLYGVHSGSNTFLISPSFRYVTASFFRVPGYSLSRVCNTCMRAVMQWCRDHLNYAHLPPSVGSRHSPPHSPRPLPPSYPQPFATSAYSTLSTYLSLRHYPTSLSTNCSTAFSTSQSSLHHGPGCRSSNTFLPSPLPHFLRCGILRRSPGMSKFNYWALVKPEVNWSRSTDRSVFIYQRWSSVTRETLRAQYWRTRDKDVFNANITASSCCFVLCRVLHVLSSYSHRILLVTRIYCQEHCTSVNRT